MPKATILGAGVSGLVCAFEFLKRGWEVRVFERDSSPGGMVKTKEYKGYKYDTGPHIYHTYDENTVKYWKENFPDVMIEKQFFCKNVKDGTFYDYPLGLTSIEQFPKELKEKIKKELEEAKRTESHKKAKNYKEYITGLIGPTLQEVFFERYPQKIWGIPTPEMSANWAPKRIEFRKKYEAFYYDQWSGIAKGGCGTTLLMLAKKIEELGGKIEYNHKVNNLELKQKAISKVMFEKGKQIDIEKEEIIISTIGIKQLASFLGVESKLRFRAVTLAYVVVNKNYVMPEGIDWLYYDDPTILFHRVTEQKKFNPENFKDGETLLCMEIACSPNDSLYNTKDEELLKKVKEQLQAIGLVNQKDIKEEFIERIPAVYPVQDVGFEIERAKVLSHIEKVSNLHITGTLAEFGYFDMQILYCKSRDLVDLIVKSENLQKDKKELVEVDLNKEIDVKDIKIGGSYPTFIIAEAGLNHNGSLEIAKQLISEAKECGCSIVKFQTFKAENRVSSKVKSAKYVEKTTGMEENFYETFKKLELSKQDHLELAEHAKEVGIKLMSTPFDEESADLLEELKVDIYKISSMDLVNLPLLKHVAEKGKPMILSTGMGTLGEIEEALDTIRKTGNQNVALLHCISSYPAPPEEMNLKSIITMSHAFQVPIGLSDHTMGSLVPVTAVALGAKIVEKHFTLDNNLEGPDHNFSATPSVMKQMVQDIRTIEAALGTGIKKPKNIEYKTAQIFKKSLFAKQNIRYGTVITPEMLTVKGPAMGIQPKFKEIIIGRKATKNILQDHPVTWDDV